MRLFYQGEGRIEKKVLSSTLCKKGRRLWRHSTWVGGERNDSHQFAGRRKNLFGKGRINNNNLLNGGYLEKGTRPGSPFWEKIYRKKEIHKFSGEKRKRGRQEPIAHLGGMKVFSFGESSPEKKNDGLYIEGSTRRPEEGRVADLNCLLRNKRLKEKSPKDGENLKGRHGSWN